MCTGTLWLRNQCRAAGRRWLGSGCHITGTPTCQGFPKQSKTPEANQSRNLTELCQISLDGPLALSNKPRQAWESVCICGGVAPLKAARALHCRSVFLGWKRWLWGHTQALLTLLVPQQLRLTNWMSPVPSRPPASHQIALTALAANRSTFRSRTCVSLCHCKAEVRGTGAGQDELEGPQKQFSYGIDAIQLARIDRWFPDLSEEGSRGCHCYPVPSTVVMAAEKCRKHFVSAKPPLLPEDFTAPF